MKRAIAALLIGAFTTTACADRTGCSNDAPIGQTLLTSPGDSAFQAIAPDTFIARFQTSRGDFFIQVPRDWSPRGADRFYNLVRNGFYDGNKFYRVVPTFVVQWGIHGDPEVSTAWARQCFDDDPVRQINSRRAITFAFGKPNTRTTQVFINYAMNNKLDRMGFSPFGEVIQGMEVLDSLYSGYGEIGPRGPGVDAVEAVKKGNAYLNAEYPLLDSIVSARVVAEQRH